MNQKAKKIISFKNYRKSQGLLMGPRAIIFFCNVTLADVISPNKIVPLTQNKSIRLIIGNKNPRPELNNGKLMGSLILSAFEC